MQACIPFALSVLTLRGEEIADVTAFITTEAPAPDREVILGMPEHPYDAQAPEAAWPVRPARAARLSARGSS